MKRLLSTSNEGHLALIRIALGLVIFPHGAQKMLGWFGGHGFSASMGHLTGDLNIPAVFAFLAIVAEFFGALGLITGLFSRVAAFGIGVTMLVAMLTHLGNGFFMNWFGNQKGEGFEYHLLAIALALVVIVKGGGAWSVDRKLSPADV